MQHGWKNDRPVKATNWVCYVWCLVSVLGWDFKDELQLRWFGHVIRLSFWRLVWRFTSHVPLGGESQLNGRTLSVFWSRNALESSGLWWRVSIGEKKCLTFATPPSTTSSGCLCLHNLLLCCWNLWRLIWKPQKYKMSFFFFILATDLDLVSVIHFLVCLIVSVNFSCSSPSPL